MKTNPRLYLYQNENLEHQLYLGKFTTLDALKALDSNLDVKVESIGATSYKDYGWAVEKNFPLWNSVKDIVSFFEQEGEFGLIEFRMELVNFGKLSTRNDSECNFILKDRKFAIDMITKVTDAIFKDKIIAYLLDNPGVYISINNSGELIKYSSIDQYLQESKEVFSN